MHRAPAGGWSLRGSPSRRARERECGREVPSSPGGGGGQPGEGWRWWGAARGRAGLLGRQPRQDHRATGADSLRPEPHCPPPRDQDDGTKLPAHAEVVTGQSCHLTAGGDGDGQCRLSPCACGARLLPVGAVPLTSSSRGRSSLTPFNTLPGCVFSPLCPGALIDPSPFSRLRGRRFRSRSRRVALVLPSERMCLTVNTM